MNFVIQQRIIFGHVGKQKRWQPKLSKMISALQTPLQSLIMDSSTVLFIPWRWNDTVMMLMRWRDDQKWDEVTSKILIGHISGNKKVGDSNESAGYLALAFSPFPGTPPPLSGFLQSLQVRRLIHLGPGLLNVSRSMSHGYPLSVSTRRRLKAFGF